MSKTYVFAGANSKVAIETATLLKQKGNKIIGISTKANHPIYDEFYTIEKYNTLNFPKITESIDGLVYFPGTINLKPFNRLTTNNFLEDYEINSLGAVAFVQAYLSNLKESTSGSIIFISTVAVSTGMSFHASISMAKGAIEGLTKSLAAEFAPNIRVNCIAPSLTNTPLAEKFINTPEKIELSQKRNPLKKIGNAIDLANGIEFLLSENSSWITGQIIAIDGGMNNIKLL